MNKILLFVILGFSFCVSIFILIDPFNFRYNNTRNVLTANEQTLLSEKILSECAIENKQQCYTRELSSLTNKYGLMSSISVLNAMQTFNADLLNCHELAHYMGSNAYSRAPWQFQSLLETIDITGCSSGFLHGLLEGYVSAHPEQSLDGDFISRTCRNSNPTKTNTCVHGFGHMLVLTSYDNLTEALPGCMNIPDTNQFECYVGVFMEHHLRPFLSLHGILPTPSFTPDYAHRLETLCGSYSGIIALACWKEMGNVYTSVYGYGAELVFSKCDNAPTDETRNECKLKSVEIIATNENNFNRSEKLQELCDLYSGRVESCISRVLSSQIESSLAFAPISSSFCADLPKYADWCFEELITKLHTRAKDASEFMAWCNKLDQTHVERCKQM